MYSILCFLLSKLEAHKNVVKAIQDNLNEFINEVKNKCALHQEQLQLGNAQNISEEQNKVKSDANFGSQQNFFQEKQNMEKQSSHKVEGDKKIEYKST